MTLPSDPSHEMHDDDLSAEAVEAMLSSGFGPPTDPELHQTLADLRSLSTTLGAPGVSAELSEFVDVHLTTNTEPVLDLADAAAPITIADPVPHVRRTPLIGQLAAFLGTLGGKICVGTTVAAASFGGAAATGAVDVPFLEPEPAQVETIEPDEPEAVAFIEEATDEPDEKPNPAEPDPERVAVDKPDEDDEPKDASEAEPEQKPNPQASDEVVEKNAQDEIDEPDTADPNVDVGGDPEPKGTSTSDDHASDSKDIKDSNDLKDNAAKDTGSEEKDDAKKDENHDKTEVTDGKTPEEEAKQEQISALDEALHVAKDAVRAEATELITPLETDRMALVAALEERLQSITDEWEPVVGDLEAALDAAETDDERLEIQAELDTARDAWEDAHLAAEVDAAPAIEAIDSELERIEVDRDEELNRLIREFLDAVAAIEAG